MQKISVNLHNKYAVYVGNDILNDPLLIEFCIKKASAVVIVTDSNLLDLYAEPLLQRFKSAGVNSHILSVVANETNKSRQTKQQLEDKLFELGCGRDTCIIALGGGITTDIAGFVAATYCRGVPSVYIPTSLLGMIDASIGGKTGVNTPFGKNLIGCFYQPKAIFSDISTLKTLPLAELRNGMAEALKHAVIKDNVLFKFIEDNTAAILDYDLEILEKLVVDNSKIKKLLVELDECDYGIRQLLNFGHTIGHALEVATEHKITHGEAVAIGGVAESYISMRMGLLAKADFERIEFTVQKYLPIKIKLSYAKETAKKALALDKKALNKQTMFVLISAIGQAYTSGDKYTHSVPATIIDEALDYVSCSDSC